MGSKRAQGAGAVMCFAQVRTQDEDGFGQAFSVPSVPTLCALCLERLRNWRSAW